MNKNAQTEAGRYITIGDPYKEKHGVPPRWKEKQLQVVHAPENSGGGYFGLMGEPFTYVPDRYADQLPYTKTQPHAQRQLGFGTHDAAKRDEFTQRIRTEQYREMLKREKRLTARVPEHKLRAARERLEGVDVKQAQEARAAVGLAAPDHLYDIGRSRDTQFDPKQARDKFYNTKTARAREMRRGGSRTASQEIGDGVWAQKNESQIHGRSHATRSFYSNGHLEVTDF